MLWYLPVQWQERNLGRPMSRLCSALTTAPLETPTLTCDSTTSLKCRTREPATFMIGANIHDNSASGRGDVDRHCTASAPTTGGATPANRQVTSTPIGMTNPATACPRPCSLLPRFRNRQLLYHHLLCTPSFLPAFLVLKRLRCQQKSRFSLSHPCIARGSHCTYL